MRRVFYALLVINLFFFGWHQIFEGNDGSAVDADVAGLAVGMVAPIRLLTEIAQNAEDELEKRTGAEKCDVYGPFFSASESGAFLRLVRKAALKGRQEEEMVRLKPYYWLYILPSASSRKAQDLVNRLRGAQVSAEIIKEGRLKNGVSLGNFETKEIIEALRKRLSKIDVVIKSEQKSRDYRQFWVLLDPGSEKRIDEKLRDKLISSYPDIFHQQKVCKAIASG